MSWQSQYRLPLHCIFSQVSEQLVCPSLSRPNEFLKPDQDSGHNSEENNDADSDLFLGACSASYIFYCSISEKANHVYNKLNAAEVAGRTILAKRCRERLAVYEALQNYYKAGKIPAKTKSGEWR
jgi:hypothetical protein